MRVTTIRKHFDSYHVFSGGDHDLLFIPVTPLYALLVAGNGLANEERVLETVNSLLALRTQVEKSLKSMGVTGELHLAAANSISAAICRPDAGCQKTGRESRGSPALPGNGSPAEGCRKEKGKGQ